MKQKKRAKTICFAMKCLGLILLACGEFNFKFTGIPIPVDSRVTRFTCALGMHEFEDERHIRDIWDQVLGSLQSFNPRVDMILLDSLVWQITGMNHEEIHRYFQDLGIAHVGANLVRLLEENSE